MKRFVVAVSIVCMFAMGMIGCEKKTSTETETRITTPGGEVTVTTEKVVKETGDYRRDTPKGFEELNAHSW